MKGPIEVTSENNRSTMDALAKILVNNPDNHEMVQRYFEAAQTLGRVGTAQQLFKILHQKYPKNYQIRSLYIALCLQQEDTESAMAVIEEMVAEPNPSNNLLDAALKIRSKVGPMRLDCADKNSISLCMIVRDESTFLGPCLFGIKALVNEIILVDTGSSDRTQDIGRIFGCQVYSYDWCNDFSVARNFSLSKASGRWILIIDADEAIAPSDFQVLRSVIRGKHQGTAAFSLATRNYSFLTNAIGWQSNDRLYPRHETGNGWFPSTKVRLFNRDQRIRFHYPVHERVEPSLKKAGIMATACSVPIHHYGLLDEARNASKAREYYKIGCCKLDEMKSDPSAIRELAVQAAQLEQWQEAVSLWIKLLALRPDYSEALINLGSAYWQLGRFGESLDWARKAITVDATLKEAHFNEAISRLMLGQPERANEILDRLLRTYPDYIQARLFNLVALASMGDCERAILQYQMTENKISKAVLRMAIQDIDLRLRGAGQQVMAQKVMRTLAGLL